jgi:putative membrane protein
VGNSEFEAMLQVFFFACVAMAGIVGAITVSKKIFWIQSLPALLGLLFLAI